MLFLRHSVQSVLASETCCCHSLTHHCQSVRHFEL